LRLLEIMQNPFQLGRDLSAFGGGSSSTILHPLVLGAIVLITVLVYLLPRRWIVFPLLIGILVIPGGQNLYIGGFHLYVYRLLILVGWSRALSAGPTSGRFIPGGLQTLDKIFLVWALYRALAVTLLFGALAGAVNQIAFLLDSLGGYFLFRSLLRDVEDSATVVKALAVVALVSSIVMAIEVRTGENVMGLLGGQALLAQVRDGHIRAQGVFGHPILAGSFGATVFSLFAWLWVRGNSKALAVTGLVSSSFAVFVWPLRAKMRLIRWGIVAAIAGLALVMKAPVWYALAHIDLAGGSTGWDRAFLVDSFITHFPSWWLIGTHANATWGYDMWDECNQFVNEGESGGLVALACLIAMLVVCFKKAGRARKAVAGRKKEEWQYWLIGTAVFVWILAFTGEDLFDQSKFSWYVLLAMIPVMTQITPRTSRKATPATPRAAQPIPMPTEPLPALRQGITTGTASPGIY
jgi:hypothetical protein